MEVKNTNDIVATKLNILVYGISGYGKTTLAKTLPPKTIVLSLEAGLLSLRGSNVEYVEVDPKNKIDSLRSILGELATSDYDTIVIDSLTEISHAFLELAKVEYPDARQTMPRFGYYNELMTRFIKYTRDLNKNVVYTCLQKDDKDDIGRVTHLPDMMGSIAKKASAYFDFVFALLILKKDDEDHRVLLTQPDDGYVAKDRSGALNKLEKPDLGLIINKVFNNNKEVKNV